MKKKLLNFVFVLFLLQIQAQKPTEKDIHTVESLIDSAYEKTLTVEMKSSSLFAKKALEISKKTSYQKGEAWSNFYIAQGLFELWAYKQSLHYLQEAEKVNQIVEDQYLTFEIHRVRSRVFAGMDLLAASVREQERGIRIIPKIPRSENDKNFLRSLAYENQAVTYSKIGDNKSFFYYLSKNKELLEKENPDIVYMRLISLYAMLGVYYGDVLQFQKAETLFKKSEDIAKKYNYPYISFTYQRWGDMELKRKNPKSAILYFEKALEILNKTNFRSEIPINYTKMATAYQELGNEAKAKELRLKALELKDEQATERQKASSSAVEEILRNEIEIAKDEHSKNRNQILIVLSTLVVILSAFFFGYYELRKRKIKKRSDEQLKNKDQEIISLQGKLNESFDDIIKLAKDNSPEFWARFQEVYPDFRSKLLFMNSDLKTSELIFCAYIYLGFNAKDIAEYTFKAVKTIKNNKYNLRKRLEIPTKDDFVVWIRNFIDEKSK